MRRGASPEVWFARMSIQNAARAMRSVADRWPGIAFAPRLREMARELDRYADDVEHELSVRGAHPWGDSSL